MESGKSRETIQRRWKRGAKVLSERDPQLAPLIALVGPPKPRLEADPYLALARAVVSQQLAPRAAEAIWKRFQEGGGGRLRWVATVEPAALRPMGVSQRKAMTLVALARDIGKGGKKSLLVAPQERVMERLVALPGIGEWTGHMFLIFCRGATDVLPIGDYGVRRGVQRLRNLSHLPNPKDLSTHVVAWNGWQSVGSWYLWKALDSGLI